MFGLSRLAILIVVAATSCSSPQHETTDGDVGPKPAAPVKNAQTVPRQSGPVRSPEVESLESRIPPPEGYTRISLDPNSFGAWLRQLPVRPGRPDVYLYNGRRKQNQSAHYAVLDIDVGAGDLQQCADAIIRLRAEYLFSGPCRDEIAFNFTSGDPARWKEWRQGVRPKVAGNVVTWERTAAADDSYESFRRYLDIVFTYAGSASLERELRLIKPATDVRVGDVYIEGGFPGHAVLVIDVAENQAGDRVFLLAQSYMPAQDIHVLTSFDDLAPWYQARSEGVLDTPEWDFWYWSVRRFTATSCEAAREQTSN